MRGIVFVAVLALTVASCSDQLPIMTIDQQKTYNDCMGGHWSGAADTFWWGPAGWAYHSSVSKDCLAKSGSLGEAATAQPSGASTTTAPSAQPVSTGATDASPAAQPSPAVSAH